MKYYVIADPHGFCSLMKKALTDKGYFDDPKPHKLILLGDIMDRGPEAEEMQEFVTEEFRRRRLILIRGNHEDLMLDMIEFFPRYRSDMIYGRGCHHVQNGTFDTALQLTGYSKYDALMNGNEFIEALKKTPYVKNIIPKGKDYYETEKFVFTHGWIPTCVDDKISGKDWRQKDKEEWESARWSNGMKFAELFKLTVPGKTVVCGHWHTSYGHFTFENKGSGEFESDSDFSPFIGNGVIALDACTVHSEKVNCITIDDEPLKK